MSDRFTRAPPEDFSGSSRGAVIRIFGVILIILGGLDIMLSWRGGFEILSFHVMLIVTGLVLYVIGAIRRHGRLDLDQSTAAASGDAGGMTSKISPATKAER
ncbi:MAG: hypothetical protein ACTSX7_11410 [Alphaproteobacteria bacterium]